MGFSRSLYAILTHVINRDFIQKGIQIFHQNRVRVMEMKLKDIKKKTKQTKPKRCPVENNACKEERGAGTPCKVRDNTVTSGREAVSRTACRGGTGTHNCPLWRHCVFSSPNSPTTTPNAHSHAISTARLSLKTKQLLCMTQSQTEEPSLDPIVSCT